MVVGVSVVFLCFKMNKLFVSVGVLAVCLVTVLAPIAISSAQMTQEPVTLVVLMYHSLRKEKSAQNDYVIDPSYFENDLKYLQKNGYETVTVNDLTEYFENGKALPEKPVMITFDDGYYNNYTYAYPLLKKYNAKAVISPIGITVDEYQKSKDKNPAYAQLDWDDIREMYQSGLVEFQNHTYNLHTTDKGRQGAAQKQGESDEAYKRLLSEDLKQFNERFEAEVGYLPSAVTFPFGAKNDLSIEVVKEMGFSAALDCENKINILKSAEDLYYIHRFIRPNNISTESFFENTVKINKAYG